MLSLLSGCAAAFSDPEVKDAVERVAGGMEKQARLVQSTHTPGEQIRAPSGAAFTVTEITDTFEGVSPAAADERVVAVHLTITNGSNQAIPLQPAEAFYVTLETGRAFRPAGVSGLEVSEIAPGESVQGVVAFSIPTDASQPRFFWNGSPMTAVPLP